MTEFRFFVPGIPAPQGSKRHVGNGRMIESSAKLRPWRDTIAWHATDQASKQDWMSPKAVAVKLVFVLPRPRSVSPAKRPMPIVKPDVDKLIRAVFDALTTARVYVDDASVVRVTAEKKYEIDGWSPGVWISLTDAAVAA